jgi:hypothetical protein
MKPPINTFISSKIKEKKNFFKQNNQQKKILIIIACHTCSLLKYNSLVNLLQYIHQFSSIHPSVNVTIYIVNSEGLYLSKKVLNNIVKNNYQYMEIPNNPMIDSGKWNHVLNKVDINEYDFTVLTNDSFITNSSINHFFNIMMYKNVELYAYTSSSEKKYHYQSYLFGLNKTGVIKFKDLYTKNQEKDGYYMELELYEHFLTKDCFLDVGNLNINYKKNIFYHNKHLYNFLFQSNLLPFIKLKKINKHSNFNFENFRNLF